MNYWSINREELLKNVCNILREASRFLNNEMSPTSEAYNPSTTVDVEISEFLTEKLYSLTRLPVISEENYIDFTQIEKGFVWIVDPLDGTLNALTKTYPFCISIALVDTLSVEAVLSCVSLPLKDEIYSAIKGKGAFLNGKKITSETVAKKIIAYGLPNNTMENIEQHLTHLGAILKEGYITRQSGSTVHDIVITAQGRYYGFYQFGLFLWDFVGADLIAHECGCVSCFRKSVEDLGGLRYDYIVANSASELEKLKTLLCY